MRPERMRVQRGFFYRAGAALGGRIREEIRDPNAAMASLRRATIRVTQLEACHRELGYHSRTGRKRRSRRWNRFPDECDLPDLRRSTVAKSDAEELLTPSEYRPDHPGRSWLGRTAPGWSGPAGATGSHRPAGDSPKRHGSHARSCCDYQVSPYGRRSSSKVHADDCC